MVCTADAEFPHSSVAVQVLAIVFVFPQASVTTSLSEMVTEPQASEPVATPFEALDSSAAHSIVTSAGAVIVGGLVSTTVMVCTADAEFPHSSEAVQVLAIVFVFPQASVTTSLSVMVT